MADATWSTEANKWEHLADLRVVKVLGSAKDRVSALSTDADVYVINRENTQWIVDYYKDKWPFDCVVIDELSSFKSASSKRFKSLKKVMRMCSHVIGLTGTPAPNGYMDLYAEMYLIDGGEALGKTLTQYRNTYFTIGAHKGNVVYQWNLKHGAKSQIDKKLEKFCLSMSKEDWLELPDIMYNNIVVRLSEEERAVYDKFEKEKVLPLLEGKMSDLDDMDSAVVGETAAVLSGKLLQMANGAVYTTSLVEDSAKGEYVHIHDRKLDALEELVECSQGQSILCFYSYKHDLERIMARFPKARKLESGADIEEWNKGNIPLMLAHPASASYGLNLQAGGHIIVWFGLPWSSELYSQAVARLYRQGQEQSVIVHHIVCEDTLDERVQAALQRKDATQRGLLEALKGYIDVKI